MDSAKQQTENPATNWARYRRFALAFVTLGIFLVSLIYSFVKTQALEERIGNQVTTTMWLVSQAEIEFLRFMTTLERYHNGDPTVLREDLAQSFDTFRSRMPVLLVSGAAQPFRVMLSADLQVPLQPLLAQLEGLGPVVGSLARDDRAAVDAIRSVLEPYGPLLHRLVIDTHREQGWRANLYRARDVTVYLELGPSLAGILFSGTLLVALFMREIRRGDDLLRKSQVAEAALVQARNLAEQANLAKSRFLVAANHDLRQPLQSIGLYTAALQATEDRRENQNICKQMSGAIEAMGNLLDVLLDIDNLEQSRVRVRRVDFPASELLEALSREFKLSAQARGLDLRIVPSSLVLHSDPLLLERIVQNIVSNAISYTNSGKIVVGCRLRGDNARIEVWDSGAGIAEAKLETIFEDYYQIDNPARDRRKGRGLGLAIVQRVARLLDHQIQVRSQLGKGSMFSVQVPLVGRAEEASAVSSPSVVPAPDLTNRVLVAIEDDPAVLDGMKRLLESWGARVVCGETARDALGQLAPAGISPDLIIADYRLPHGDTGVGVVEALRAAFDADVPAIVITGDTSTSVARLIEASGCLLVHKPLDSVTLRRLIQKQLDIAPNSRSSEEMRAKSVSAIVGPGPA